MSILPVILRRATLLTAILMYFFPAAVFAAESAGGFAVVNTLSGGPAALASNLPESAHLFVLGYLRQGDGGGGFFDRVPSCRSDKGTCFRDKAGHFFRRQFSGPVHSAWFGVLAANSDNTAAAQAMIDFENANRVGVVLDACSRCDFLGTVNFFPRGGHGELGTTYASVGYVHWRHRGGGVGFKAVPANDKLYWYNFHLGSLHLECDEGAAICFQGEGIGQGSDVDIDVWGSKNVNVKFDFVVQTKLKILVSGNIHATHRAAVGVVFDRNSLGAGVQDCQITLAVEGMEQGVTGKKFRANTVYGTVEGNAGTALQLDVTSTWNVFSAMDMEANARDLDIYGAMNSVNGGIYSSPGGSTVRSQTTLTGAEFETLVIAKGTRSVLQNVQIDSRLSDVGADTTYHGCVKVAGSCRSQRP